MAHQNRKALHLQCFFDSVDLLVNLSPAKLSDFAKCALSYFGQLLFSAHTGVQIPVRVTKRNKSELFRQSNLVRICFLLLNLQIDAISERGHTTSLFSTFTLSFPPIVKEKHG